MSCEPRDALSFPLFKSPLYPLGTWSRQFIRVSAVNPGNPNFRLPPSIADKADGEGTSTCVLARPRDDFQHIGVDRFEDLNSKRTAFWRRGKEEDTESGVRILPIYVPFVHGVYVHLMSLSLRR